MQYRDPPTIEARLAISEALRILARLDPDHADYRNGAGFSAADSRRGHQLAAMPALLADDAIDGLDLVTRYWRQLPAHLVAAARRQPPRRQVSLADALDDVAALSRRRAA